MSDIPTSEILSSEQSDLFLSFYTTCKGRLEHLQQTLPEKLATIQAYPNAELVILAYGDDETANWIQNNYSDEIRNGRIRLGAVPEEEAPGFEFSYVKNIAARLAMLINRVPPVDPKKHILISLDADTTVKQEYVEWLIRNFSKHPDTVTGIGLTTKLKNDLQHRSSDAGDAGKPQLPYGLVAINAQNFAIVGGYDQAIGYGEDTNLVDRGWHLGLHAKNTPIRLIGGVIKHSDAERVIHMDAGEQAASAEVIASLRGMNGLDRLKLATLTPLLRPRPDNLQANPGGNYGCANVIVTNPDLSTQMITFEPAPVSTEQLHHGIKTLMRKAAGTIGGDTILTKHAGGSEESSHGLYGLARRARNKIQKDTTGRKS